MPLVTRPSWGNVTAFIQATQVVGGVESVVPNVGIAIVVPPQGRPTRLAKLAWRVDLSPDQVPGTVEQPDRWRVCVFQGPLPQDVTSMQTSAAYQNVLGIPQNNGQRAPVPVLWDEWLDATVSFPGLNAQFDRDFADSGPEVSGGEFMTIILVPIIWPMLQIAVGVATAQLSLSAFGTIGIGTGGPGGPDRGLGSLPRYDVGFGSPPGSEREI